MRSLLRGLVLRVLYPALMAVGAFSKGKKERFQLLVIGLNNRLVRQTWRVRNGASDRVTRVLLLLPHCLQTDECDVRITHNVSKCKRCGRCEIKDLVEIAEARNLAISVATGGTIARRIVTEARPDAIVAVACERDLSSGIVDTYPLPVLGITNERPCGPCLNTKVDLSKVKEALDFLGRR